MLELSEGRVTDYLYPHEKRDKATEEKERFKFHRKANWKFPQEAKRREAFQSGGPLCTKQRQGESITGAFEEIQESLA